MAPDAEWCGQCFASLRAPDPPSDVATPAANVPIDVVRETAEGPERGGPVAATWTCPTCGEANDLAANACAVCGTPFARLFEQPSQPPAISPTAAAAWSLVFPGIGHWRLGRVGDAIARLVLGVWALGTLAILLSSSGEGSLGLAALIALYGLATVAIWLVTAVDAARAAIGVAPIVGSRVLVWSCVGLIVLSMIIATMIALPALDRPPAQVPSG